ncbi:MAG: L-asparaginase [Candidatus Wallbacteria bacterium HGW-Wallbacteria-1]|uniref:L-asparaginase n=1 Tax=Candidatus Wallbacteria bacterium HGW-Wallbacteria-1 TaxID=2013854 RepID=A0A2N1PRN4_9BACT|nr:MAG: L-asparaginase [Candidatus Wallbacteria bacterium HGW-Wallbacteria-1]
MINSPVNERSTRARQRSRGKVCVFTTGGTIAMLETHDGQGLMPARTGMQLLDAVPDLASVCDIELREFSNLPSPHIHPRDIFALRNIIREIIDRDDVDGVVVTHGTDTLEESAYLMELTLSHHKPVVFTAAMKPGSTIGADGPMNILSACMVAVSREARGHGVLVVMNEEIHTAREVRKTYTSNVATFHSPGYGPIGLVDSDRVIFLRKSLIRQKFDVSHLEEKVGLIKVCEGNDDLFIRCAIDNNFAGLVIEGFGRGDVPPGMVASITQAISSGMVLVMTSRCFQGRVLGVYGYDGGGADLKRRGVLFCGDLSGPKARIKLMVALASTRDRNKLDSIMEMEDISWGK